MSDLVVPVLPFFDLPRAVETIRAAGGWLHCETRDLITLWKNGSIELCFNVPDWVAFEGMDAPGEGVDVLLSVDYGSFLYWRKTQPASWPPLPYYVAMCVRRYGTAEPYEEKKLTAWAYPLLDERYRQEDDGGERLAEALNALYSSDALVIPRAELVKAIGIFTAPLPVNPPAQNATAPKVHGNAEHNARNREQALKVAIGVLADHPDECRGSKKDPSPEKWTEAVLKYAKDYPPFILGKEKLKELLKEAVNLKIRTERKGVRKITHPHE